jgi:hypothetical protein
VSPGVSRVLVVDAANVVGTRPDGWWKDRAGAARRLHDALLRADVPYDEVVLVLEGQAKAAMPPGTDGHVRVVHARGHGDDAILAEVRRAAAAGHVTTVATADRLLAGKAEHAGAAVLPPSRLLEQL